MCRTLVTGSCGGDPGKWYLWFFLLPLVMLVYPIGLKAFDLLVARRHETSLCIQKAVWQFLRVGPG